MSWLVPRSDLTPDQLRAVELPTNEAKVIFGPPGSGKTQVLLHRADHLRHRLNARPDQFRIFLFTNVLRDYIRAALADLDLPIEAVSTFDAWCKELYERHVSRRLPWSEAEGRPDFEAVRRDVLNLFRSKPALRFRLRFAMVDEGQDLTEESFEILKYAALHVTVCADPLQQIYEGASEDAILRVLGVPRRNATLLGAYRNSPDVAQLASYFIADERQREHYLAQIRTVNVQRERPVLLLARSHDEEMDHVARVVVERQRMDQRVAVLVPQNRFVHGYAAALAERGVEIEKVVARNRGDAEPDFLRNTPKILAYHSAKGLTFDCVVLPRLTDSSFGRAAPDKRSRLLFVGITRATRWVCLSRREETPFAQSALLRRAAAQGHLTIRDSGNDLFSTPPGQDPSDPRPPDELLFGL